jgi:protein-S-isoprenylcysteine O-methyltransferase Ste14
MHYDPNHLVELSWIIVGIVWAVGSLRSSPIARRQSITSRSGHVILLVACGALLYGKVLAVGPLSRRFVPDTSFVQWAGSVITTVGIGFAIAARLALGRNWSGVVSVKKDHQLIRSGPYAIVRHPIYAGLLLGILGTAVVGGEVRGLIALALATLGLRLKSLQEERFMNEEFDGEYQDYKKHVKAIIPLVW